jgi:2,4-dienoyl-CoA reductase-like NADH-dependent reductase (Old Yellow Enzyme family)
MDQGGWQPVAPSPVPFDKEHPVPHMLTHAEINGVTKAFAAAARRAVAVGFDTIELHMAHGYLLHEFLSPLSNQRSDEYGGTLDHRMRLPIEVARAVRTAIPAGMPLLVRISATDWADGGWDIGQSVELAKHLKESGVDLIDCSTGGLVPHVKIPAQAGYQVPFAEGIRRQADTPTGAVGLITDPRQAEDILAHGRADVVLIARELLRDPYWPLHAARQLGDDVPWPKQYERAKPSPR